VLITHRFGRAAAKPSTLCFERILAAEKGAWSDLVYVGDNPAKDFVSLNARGAFTVRVLTGCHAGAAANPGHDGAVTITDLNGLPAVLAERFPHRA
jgi:putative hydrolase of the HAD superfamily